MVIIIHLIVGLIKRHHIKWINIFPSHMNHLVEILMLEFIYLIMQQRMIYRNITHIDTWSFGLKTNLVNLKTEVDKLDIDKLKSLPNNLSNLKTEVDKLDIAKLVLIPTDLSKLSDVVKNEVV